MLRRCVSYTHVSHLLQYLRKMESYNLFDYFENIFVVVTAYAFILAGQSRRDKAR